MPEVPVGTFLLAERRPRDGGAALCAECSALSAFSWPKAPRPGRPGPGFPEAAGSLASVMGPGRVPPVAALSPWGTRVQASRRPAGEGLPPRDSQRSWPWRAGRGGAGLRPLLSWMLGQRRRCRAHSSPPWASGCRLSPAESPHHPHLLARTGSPRTRAVGSPRMGQDE